MNFNLMLLIFLLSERETRELNKFAGYFTMKQSKYTHTCNGLSLTWKQIKVPTVLKVTEHSYNLQNFKQVDTEILPQKCVLT